MSSTNKYKLAALLSTGILFGSGFTYYRINQINSILGNDILQNSLSMLKNQLNEQNQTINQDSQLYYHIYKFSNLVELFVSRYTIYLNRLLHLTDYQQICQKVNKRIIDQLICSYEKESIFQYQEIINQCKEHKTFNNKLAQKLIKIQAKNASIKHQNKFLLERFYQMQQLLFTDHIYQLSSQSKQKINVIYDYFRGRQKYLKELIEKQQILSNQIRDKNERMQQQMSDKNYAFKMQYI